MYVRQKMSFSSELCDKVDRFGGVLARLQSMCTPERVSLRTGSTCRVILYTVYMYIIIIVYSLAFFRS